MRRQFSVEYKIEVAKHYSEHTIKQTATEYGLGQSTISRWSKDYNDGLLDVSNATSISRKPKQLIGIAKVHADLRTQDTEFSRRLDRLASEIEAINNDRKIITRMLSAYAGGQTDVA